MEAFLLELLGPYANPVMAISAAVVVWQRRRMVKRHIVWLLVLTIVGFLAFFAILVWGIRHWPASPESFQLLLKLIAALTIGCSSAIGFWLILKSLGLLPKE